MSVKGSRCEAAFFCLYRSTDYRQRTTDFGFKAQSSKFKKKFVFLLTNKNNTYLCSVLVD